MNVLFSVIKHIFYIFRYHLILMLPPHFASYATSKFFKWRELKQKSWFGTNTALSALSVKRT